MSKRMTLLQYSTLILVIIFLQTCNARKSKPYCPPSACGHIHNISYPFHLNTEPEDCRDAPTIELACEAKQTVIWLFSNKFHVQAINYDNKTIHLVDPTFQTQDDPCSFRSRLNFSDYYHGVFYYTKLAEPIFRFNCPFAVDNNSSTSVEISGCKLSRYTYLRIGEMNVSEVSDGCRAEFIGLTSWPNTKETENNISLSDFRQAILYGVELHYLFGRRISVIQMILRYSWDLLQKFVWNSGFLLLRLFVCTRGTIGYVAPELISRSIGAISYKADVYSFGMLLMEMLDLKRNEVASEENSSQYFPYYIYDKLNKGKEIVVDDEANDDEKKMARKLSLVALWCIQTNPVQRPSMSKVVEMLEGEAEVLQVPPQPLQSQPIVHQIMGSSMTFSSDSIALLENSADYSTEVDIGSN